jgi:mannitol/fructose-specific phosphotransferase system IIA component (Ntr-type)
MPQLLAAERIVLWEEPVAKQAVLRRLAETVEHSDGAGDSSSLLDAILEREKQGSTFFNEGVAFPHARIEGLVQSIVSLGVTIRGISDERTQKPIELVFFILSPAQKPDEQVKILALASKLAQNRHFRQALHECRSPAEVMDLVRAWEREDPQKAAQ